MRKVHNLQKQLSGIRSTRENQSKRRRRSVNQSVAIVGYTNAGKSSLLNCLTRSDDNALVADRLFATLDPVTRALQLPGGEKIFVSDTVGFVRNLPHQLVEAFKTTLDVVTEADLLIHVVDGSNLNAQKDIAAVRKVLDEIGVTADLPELIVFNKVDISGSEPASFDYPNAVQISAKTGEGVEKMMSKLSDILRSNLDVYELAIPLTRGDLIAQVHREAQVLIEDVQGDTLIMRARLDGYAQARLRGLIKKETE